MSGKGSKQRPTDQKKFNDNWDVIFGKKTAEELKVCSVCKTTEGVEWVGGYQEYRCGSVECIPF